MATCRTRSIWKTTGTVPDEELDDLAEAQSPSILDDDPASDTGTADNAEPEIQSADDEGAAVSDEDETPTKTPGVSATS